MLSAVAERVGYLRARTDVPADEDGWVRCDAVTPAVIEAALPAGDRVVGTSLLAQSHAFKVVAVTLAAFAVGLPWPDPDPAAMAVRLVDGRARGVAYLDLRPRGPGDPEAVVAALAAHLDPVAAAFCAATRLGARLVAGNTAASSAAALRAVEGAARDRGDGAERAAVRAAGAAWWEAAGRVGGRFEVVGDDWLWRRTSCCLWYRTSDRTCDDCSLTGRTA